MGVTVPTNEAVAHTVKGQFTYFSRAEKPVLELKEADNQTVRVPFTDIGAGRTPAERRWLAEPTLSNKLCQFRIDLGNGVFDTPIQRLYYSTSLHTLWLQDKQLFDYAPARHVAPSQVIKIEGFEGQLAKRALYIYLPRGYSDHRLKHYPIIYMHDGQNVFEAFVSDSYSGSWRADKVADRLISNGRMRESIIVGVSNGGEQRILEYLPPYSQYRMPPAQSPLAKMNKRHRGHRKIVSKGRANQTAAYYQQDVAAYLFEHYRVLSGRDETATIGSSMGGLFSAYLAWDHSNFAKHHAVMSPSFWITRQKDERLAMLERFRKAPKPDIRLWLDSGTGDPNTDSDDNMGCTLQARDILLKRGFVTGKDFQYYLAEGAVHHESAWAARLDKVFCFLMPAT